MSFKRCIARTVSLLISFLLASCSLNPFTSDNHLTGNLAGPAVGGAVGAGTALWLDTSKPVMVLAGVGGAALGYYFTTIPYQAGPITNAGGQVFANGDYMTIEIPSDQLFDSNTADLIPNATPILNSVVTILNRYPDTNVLISGNTSGFGTQRREHQLSEARARQVAAYLWNKGIQDYNDDYSHHRRLIYLGYGNHFPIANDLHNNSIRSNSRIQINLYPSQGSWKPCPTDQLFSNYGNNELSTYKGDYREPGNPDAYRGRVLSDEASNTTSMNLNAP